MIQETCDDHGRNQYATSMNQTRLRVSVPLSRHSRSQSQPKLGNLATKYGNHFNHNHIFQRLEHDNRK